MVHRYNSLEEIVEAGRKSLARGKARSINSASGDYGHETYADTLALTLSGSDKLVSKAEALLEDIMRIDAGESIQYWDGAPFGAYPVVPEYLAGMPTCMRALVETPDTSPVNIYACTSASGGFDGINMVKRGVAILALVMKLQRVRPVQLYVVEEGYSNKDGAFIQVLPLGSTPLSLAHACYCLTSPGFTRHLFYAAPDGLGTGGTGYQWPRERGNDTRAWCAWMRKHLGLGRSDLYIPSMHWDDLERTQITEDPIAWINGQITRINESEQQG